MKFTKPTKLRPDKFYLAYFPSKHERSKEWVVGSSFIQFQEYAKVWRRRDLGMVNKSRGLYYRVHIALKSDVTYGNVNITMRTAKCMTWFELDEEEALLYIVTNQL